MAIIDQFENRWRIVSPGCHFFPECGILSIGVTDKARTHCDVVWHDDQGMEWRITSIPLVGDALEQYSIGVWSPQDPSLSYQRRVKLWISDNGLLDGYVVRPTTPPADGPVGTFTAEADDPEVELDATRPEERIAV